MVDGIMGSSSGGIVAACLSTPDHIGGQKPRFSAEMLKHSYAENASKAFSFRAFLNAAYSALGWQSWTDYESASTYIEELLKEHYDDIYLSHVLTHLMITTYNTEKHQLEIFNSRRAVQSPRHDLKVREAVRATTALHFMFGPATVQFNTSVPIGNLIDAGTRGYNDPTSYFCDEILRMHPDRKDRLSLLHHCVISSQSSSRTGIIIARLILNLRQPLRGNLLWR